MMKNKKLFGFAFAMMLIACGHLANAQGVSVNTTGNDADPSAMLDVNSTTQGMLVPRMTAAQRGLITTPATGLLVYQTDGTKGFYFYSGSAWVSLNAYTNVTTQGNTFNGNSQLVQTDGSGALPAISGANLTNLNFLPLAGGAMNDAANIAVGTGTGTKIGTGTAQKLGFYGANPVTQQSGDVASALGSLGLVSSPTISATTNANMTGDVTSVGNATSYNNKVPLTKGGTNSDLSATGGAGSYLKQTTTGGAVTVGTISAGDIPILNQNTTGNAATVTTNANLSGPISSSGNTTSITSQTGTGTKFVMDASPTITSPTLVTPALGTPASGSLVNCTFPTLNQNTTGNAATVTTNANMTGDVTSVGNATSYNNKVPLTKGGTNSDLSVTGGAGSYLKQTTTGGAVTVDIISAGDIPILNQNTTGNAATVTTNANLSGPISSTGNTTSITSQTGTGTKFVMDASPTITSPTLVAPALGTPTSGDLVNCTFPTLNQNTTGNAATVTTNANLSGPISSSGNTTSITSQTGTGTKFVMEASPTITSPTLVTPALGTPASGDLVNCTFPTLNQNTTGNAATVTTNANLSGPITSSGNTTSITSQTGTGTKFVMDASPTITSPTLVAPALGTPASGNLVNCTFPTLNQNTTGNAATVTTNANLSGPITSSGNTTSITSQTGTGTKFVMDASPTITSPTLVAPALGTPASGNLVNCTFPTLNQNTTGNAATVTTNANLSGPISSSGNTTSITSQTGTGTKFVMDASPTITSPTLVAPALGVATGTSLTLSSSLNEAQGADIASATTTDIGAATGNYINVTGTATITSLGSAQAGTRRIVTFKGAATLTYNATSLILPGGANLTTAAEDAATFISLGSGNWKCVNYSLAAGTGGGGGGAVSSVSNSDGTLTISPTTGAVVGSLALGHANNWTGQQTFVAPVLGAATGTSLTLSSTLNEAQGADIASAATTDLGAATGNYINVTGAATITSLGTAQAGTERIVTFKGAATLTYNATSLILPGTANITTAAEDVANFMSLGGGNWKCTNYSRAIGIPLMVFSSFQTPSTVNTNFFYPIGGALTGGGATLFNDVSTKFPVGMTITKMVVVYVSAITMTTAGSPVCTLYKDGVATSFTNTWASAKYSADVPNTSTIITGSLDVPTTSSLAVMFNISANGKIAYVMVTLYGHY